ncbi:MAG: orotidine-5'-phosphate decarboxylase [Phycisphaeraceae bacterium]|nr:orotidine-5'-phosphate decarboxylase [Phycisphaerales bacterium]MCB9859028.1 orotidine-5'-phosphate decarboxylase [Phycisphaeraceae bacterium]
MPETVIGAMDHLVLSIDRVRSPACVGLDPVLDRLPNELKQLSPVDAIEQFCIGVIDAAMQHVGVVKPQSACFERYGSLGMRALERVCDHANKHNLHIILDAKRGDIGISAAHYAAWAQEIGAHSITVNGYLGMETIEPYLDAGLGVFVLVRTSNPGSDAVQCSTLNDNRTVAQMMADQVSTLGASHMGTSGISDVGAVVGATKSSEGADLRKHMPDTMFLVPGYGAQGGTIDDIRALVRLSGNPGVIVNASRSVLYPKEPESESWQDGVATRAQHFAEELRSLYR